MLGITLGDLFGLRLDAYLDLGEAAMIIIELDWVIGKWLVFFWIF